MIEIENRRYIGSKTQLSDWIFECINSQARDCKSFCDIFAGTGIVSKKAMDIFEKVIINDFLFSNEVFFNAFFYNENYDKIKINKLIDRWNSIESDKISENYFSKNFGGKFFDHNHAKKIGFIREELHKNKSKFNNKELSILLTTLIYNIDRVSNTVGHFDAYIKKPIPKRELVFKNINSRKVRNVKIFREDANILAKKINSDIVYIDPPYNSRQYSRFYHIYENLVQWKKPKLFGVALKPEAENMSKYCRITALNAFKELINDLNAKYLVVSYNNTYSSKSSSSENKIKLEEIKEVLKSKGRTKVFNAPHKFFNAGKTDFKDHKEYLFITKVNEK